MSLRSSSMADAYLRGIIVVILWCSSAGDGDTYFLRFRQKKNVKIVCYTISRCIRRRSPLGISVDYFYFSYLSQHIPVGCLEHKSQRNEMRHVYFSELPFAPPFAEMEIPSCDLNCYGYEGIDDFNFMKFTFMFESVLR